MSRTSSLAPVKPRSRSRSSLKIRFICANRISIFLRSRCDCWKARCWPARELISQILVDVSCDLAHDRRGAFWLQRADRAVVLVGPVVDDVALIDVASAGQLRATWANVNITLPVEDEVGSAEGTGAVRLLKWLMERKITPHVPVWDKSARHDVERIAKT